MSFIYGSQEHSTGVGVSSFATNLHFESPTNLAASRGDLFIASIVNSPDARVGKELRELLNQRYYSPEWKSAFDAITSSIGEAVHLFRQRQTPIEVSAVTIVDNVAYLVAANGAFITLVRDGIATQVLSSEESEVKSASGYLQEGDIVLLQTHNLLEIVPNTKLHDLLGGVNDLQELKEAYIEEMVGYKKPLAFNMLQVEPAPVNETSEVQEQALISAPANPARVKITHLLDSIIRLIPEKRVVVKEDTLEGVTNKKSKVPVVVGLVLLVVLVASIGLGVRARNEQNKKAEYADELLSAQHQFEESRSLAGINSSRAKELILSARETVVTLEEQGIVDEQLKVLGTQIEQSMGDIAGIYNQQPSTFLDLTLIRADFTGTDLSFSDGVVRVLDENNKRMTLINSSTKKTENIADLDLLPNAMQTTAYSDNSYILSTDGIREVQGEIALVVKSEEWSSKDVLIGAFGGNLYVMDKPNNRIWRYPGGINSFGSGQEWFAPGINVNVSSAISWSIDGKVWILKEGGDILVYERGLPQKFTVVGVNDTSGFRQIFTDESAQNVYLLDTQRGRVVVLEKSGAYKGEYHASELSNATDLVVSEADKKIIFLAQNKLWELELQ